MRVNHLQTHIRMPTEWLSERFLVPGVNSVLDADARPRSFSPWEKTVGNRNRVSVNAWRTSSGTVGSTPSTRVWTYSRTEIGSSNRSNERTSSSGIIRPVPSRSGPRRTRVGPDNWQHSLSAGGHPCNGPAQLLAPPSVPHVGNQAHNMRLTACGNYDRLLNNDTPAPTSVGPSLNG